MEDAELLTNANKELKRLSAYYLAIQKIRQNIFEKIMPREEEAHSNIEFLINRISCYESIIGKIEGIIIGLDIIEQTESELI